MTSITHQGIYHVEKTINEPIKDYMPNLHYEINWMVQSTEARNQKKQELHEKIKKVQVKISRLESEQDRSKKDIYTIERAIGKSNYLIHGLSKIYEKCENATGLKKIIYKIEISIKEFFSGHLNDLKKTNEKLIDFYNKHNLLPEIRKLKNLNIENLSEKTAIGNINNIENQVTESNIENQVTEGPQRFQAQVIGEAEGQINKDLNRDYTLIINGEIFNKENNSNNEAINALEEISNENTLTGKYLLYKLCTQNLPILLKNSAYFEFANKCKPASNGHFQIQDIDDNHTISITKKEGVFHINFNTNHQLNYVAENDKTPIYNLSSSIELQLDGTGMILTSKIAHNIQPETINPLIH